MYQVMAPFKELMRKQRHSQRSLSELIGLSRTSLRQVFEPIKNLNLKTIKQVAEYFDQQVCVISYKTNYTPNSSTVAVCYKVERDGFESWKVHLMDLVDEFRSTLDMRILLLPPTPNCPVRLQALLASTTMALCNEVEVESPGWVKKIKPLAEPWFVSGMESLKASAVLESPIWFRKNNIFVQENFLERA